MAGISPPPHGARHGADGADGARDGAAVTPRALARLHERPQSEPPMPRFEPTPDPHGSLGPPDRHPPTAVGTATPPPPRPPRPAVTRARRGLFRRAVDGALDVADRLADALRSVVAR